MLIQLGLIHPDHVRHILVSPRVRAQRTAELVCPLPLLSLSLPPLNKLNVRASSDRSEGSYTPTPLTLGSYSVIPDRPKALSPRNPKSENGPTELTKGC